MVHLLLVWYHILRSITTLWLCWRLHILQLLVKGIHLLLSLTLVAIKLVLINHLRQSFWEKALLVHVLIVLLFVNFRLTNAFFLTRGRSRSISVIIFCNQVIKAGMANLFNSIFCAILYRWILRRSWCWCGRGAAWRLMVFRFDTFIIILLLAALFKHILVVDRRFTVHEVSIVRRKFLRLLVVLFQSLLLLWQLSNWGDGVNIVRMLWVRI